MAVDTKTKRMHSISTSELSNRAYLYRNVKLSSTAIGAIPLIVLLRRRSTRVREKIGYFAIGIIAFAQLLNILTKRRRTAGT